MSGQALEMGPWPLGLDQISAATQTENKALKRAVNWDILDDGTLAARRVFTQLASGSGVRVIGTTIGIVLPPPAPADPTTVNISSYLSSYSTTSPSSTYSVGQRTNTAYGTTGATLGYVINVAPRVNFEQMQSVQASFNPVDISNFTNISFKIKSAFIQSGSSSGANLAQTFSLSLTDVNGTTVSILSSSSGLPTYNTDRNFNFAVANIAGLDKTKIVGYQVYLEDVWSISGSTSTQNLTNNVLFYGLVASGYIVPPVTAGSGFQHLVGTVLTRNVAGNDQLQLYTSESSYPAFTTAAPIISSPVTANGIIATACIDYNGFTYISTAAQGIYRSSGGLIRPTGTAFTAVANTPNGKIIGMTKSRMFLMGTNADGSFTNRMYYAKATDPTAWTTTGVPPDGGFFDIDPDTNGAVTQAFFINDQIYIFKPNATYVFSYSTDPGVDGVLRKLSDTLGGWDACVYRNEPWVINATSVYRIVNNTFIDMAERLRLQFDYRAKIAVINRTLVITNNNLANFLSYAMNFNIGAWSQYAFYAGYEPDLTYKPSVVQSSAGVDCWVNCRNNVASRWAYATNLMGDGGTDTLLVGGVPTTYYPLQAMLTGANQLGNVYRWARLYWWSLEGDFYFNQAVANTQQLVVNESQTINSVPRAIDGQLSFSRVVTVSIRFQNISFAFNLPDTVVAGNISKTSAALARPNITGIRLYAALKENVEI